MIAVNAYDNVTRWLSECKRPLIVSHRRPDGDALGAMLGLAEALGQMQVEPLVTLFEAVPARYAFLVADRDLHRWDRECTVLRDTCDALVIVDTCSYAQLEPLREFLDRAPRTLVIDHHPTGDGIGLRAGDLRLIDDHAGAVCLLIAEWIQVARLRTTPTIATALFTGLATDTGWFRFSNANARELRSGARLIEAGAQSHKIYDAVFQREPAAKLRLIGRMLQQMALHADGKIALLTLRRADFDAVGADRTMTEDLVNEATRLANTELTILVMEEPDGSVRANFRSKTRVNVARLAQRFGGGGHARAAGARPKGAWDEVVTQILAAAEEALASDNA